MDVVNAEQVHQHCRLIDATNNNNMQTSCQARIAEEAGACAVMALERVPADIRAEGGVARMVCRAIHLSIVIIIFIWFFLFQRATLA